MKKRIIVTGGAGFIGSNLCDYLISNSYEVICIDSFDSYYSSEIKWSNITEAQKSDKFKLVQADINKCNSIRYKFEGEFDSIIHLAAKAGVRYSLQHPIGYEESNVQGTKNILELAKNLKIKQFVFASSSSIYGNAPTPFNEGYTDLKPISPYAQTKLLSETTGKLYSEKYGINFISLRFFSVYGPRLRPDLVMNKIARSIYYGEKMKLFGDGSAARDYTFVDDIIQGIVSASEYDSKGFEVFNLGSGKPVKLSEIINHFQEIKGKNIDLEQIDSIQGESDITWAENYKAKRILGFKPDTNIKEGILRYLNWYESNL